MVRDCEPKWTVVGTDECRVMRILESDGCDSMDVLFSIVNHLLEDYMPMYDEKWKRTKESSKEAAQDVKKMLIDQLIEMVTQQKKKYTDAMENE